MRKRTIMLAMALGAMAALVLPASASAFWKHKHDSPIMINQKVGLTGDFSVTSQAGGMKCQITSEVQMVSQQTTGFVDTFEVDKENSGTPTTRCQGSGGLAFCQGHVLQPTNLPWLFHTTENGAGEPDVQITAGEIHGTLTGGFCPAAQITITPATYTAVPNAPLTIATFDVQGKVHVIIGQFTDAAATVHGDPIVEPPNTHTYSI